MSVTPSSLQLGCRTSYYAQLLRPPCARFGVLGSWRYGGLPVVIPWPDKVQAVEATHAQLSMIDQAQLAPKRCCRAVFLGDLLSRFRPPRLDTPRPQRVESRLVRKTEQARTGQNLWAAAT